MIKYNLKCTNGHEFESWFQNSDACDKILKNNLTSCPTCSDTNIVKALMAPAIPKKGATKLYEYVGEKFADEVRAVHYGKKVAEADILGTVTKSEAEELYDEGIDFQLLDNGEMN
jgi:hypothetical protein